MKKFELHLDALIAMFVVFALIIAFLLYQRSQYSDLTQENIDLVWENVTLQASLDYKTARLDDCKSSTHSMEESGTESELINPSE